MQSCYNMRERKDFLLYISAFSFCSNLILHFYFLTFWFYKIKGKM